MDISNDPEGIKGSNTAKTPPSFEEHMRELKELINSLPTDDDEGIDHTVEDSAKKQAIEDARNAVLQTFKHNERPKVNLEKPRIKVYDETGNIVETHAEPSKTHTSWFNRYPEQADRIKQHMYESYKKGEPLKVLNIGVSQGQEAMGYIQMASDIAGEDKINDALDLELVEYAVEIPITKDKLPENISETSRDYLKNLYQTDKAHFGTPFQEYVKELKEKGEKRDVILFNNVIQHLDYKNSTVEEMSEDMQNLIDITDENGIFCMTCVGNALHPHAKNLLGITEKKLKERGFYEEPKGVFRKFSETLSEISATF